MKKLIALFIAAFFITASVNAQTPAPVMKAFNSSFSDVTSAKWFSSGDNHVVHFDQNGVSMVITYDRFGTLLGSKRVSEKENMLPLNVLHNIRQKYADKHITLITEKFEEGVISYTVQLQNDKQIWIISSTGDGNFAVLDKINK